VKILVFLDDPASAHEVVRTVGKMAAKHEGELEIHLSRVLNFGGGKASPQAARQPVGAGVGSAAATPWTDTAKKSPVGDAAAADEYLARLAYRYLAGVTTKRVVFGNTPAAEIIAYARHEDIDLIAIADQGKRGIEKMLLYNGTVPLLTVSCQRTGLSNYRAGSYYGSLQPDLAQTGRVPETHKSVEN